MRKVFTLLAMACLGLPATAQDRAGRDTPGEWLVTHQKPFGLWDSFCDKRTTGDLIEQRCYLRYVDVFSRAPQFAAQFLFVTPQGVEIGTERGTRFSENGMRIESGGETIWRTDRIACLRGRDCVFESAAAEDLLARMKEGDVFGFDFVDRHGNAQSLAWDLTQFSDARADYETGLAALGLE